MSTRFSKPIRIVFALLGDVRINSRAIRQIRALLEMGARVHVYCYGSPNARDPFNGQVAYHLFEPPQSSGIRYFYVAHRRLKRLLKNVTAEVYHASDLYSLPAVFRSARKHRGALVFDSRELYPYVGYASRKPWVSLFWHIVEGRFIRRCDAVFTVNDSIANRISRTYGIDRPVVIPNIPPRREVIPSNYLRDQTRVPPSTPILLYQGHVKRGRGCEVLLEAAKRVPGAALVYLGDGDLRAELQRRASDPSIAGRVFFLDPVAPDDLLEVTAGADVGLCLIEDLSLSLRYALPNKLFEYLMAGVPVLVTDLPEMAHIVRTHDVGMVLEEAEPVRVADALNRMVANKQTLLRWGKNTQKLFETFNWEKASQVFKTVYAKLIK